MAIDYSVTFEDWTAKWEKPPDMSQRAEEAKVEAAFANARKSVIEIDRLGVIR